MEVQSRAAVSVWLCLRCAGTDYPGGSLLFMAPPFKETRWKLTEKPLHSNGVLHFVPASHTLLHTGPSFATSWDFLNLFFLCLLCRNSSQESRPALANSMPRPQLGQSVSLPLDMGTAPLPSRSGGAQLLFPFPPSPHTPFIPKFPSLQPGTPG